MRALAHGSRPRSSAPAPSPDHGPDPAASTHAWSPRRRRFVASSKPHPPSAAQTRAPHCSSEAPRSMNRSNVASTTLSGCAAGRSTLFTTTSTCLSAARAFCSTNRVWGMGPSTASTSSSTPSAMLSTLSTSPPKSAWPGVSMMLIFTPCMQCGVGDRGCARQAPCRRSRHLRAPSGLPLPGKLGPLSLSRLTLLSPLFPAKKRHNGKSNLNNSDILWRSSTGTCLITERSVF